MVQLVTHLFMVVAFLLFFPPSLSLFAFVGSLGREELEKKRTKEAITFAFFLSFFLFFPPPKFPFV